MMTLELDCRMKEGWLLRLSYLMVHCGLVGTLIFYWLYIRGWLYCRLDIRYADTGRIFGRNKVALNDMFTISLMPSNVKDFKSDVAN